MKRLLDKIFGGPSREEAERQAAAELAEMMGGAGVARPAEPAEPPGEPIPAEAPPAEQRPRGGWESAWRGITRP